MARKGKASPEELTESVQDLQKMLRDSASQMERWGRWARELLEMRDEEISALRARVEALEERLTEGGGDLRLSNAEKRDAIRAYLLDPERTHWSDREIARQVGASPQTVANWRQRLSLPKGSERQGRTVIRGGKVFTMRTENIGQARKD